MSSIRWRWPSVSGSMRCAISCCAKCRSARTEAIAPRRSSIAPMPSSRTASAISRSALCRWSPRIWAALFPRQATDAEDVELARPGAQGGRRRGSRGVRALRLLGRDRGLAAGGFRLQPICRCAGAVGAAQDRSRADGGACSAHWSSRCASSRARSRRSSRIRPISCMAVIDAGAGGAPIAAADAIVPAARARRGRGSGGVTLIDSHCHLNYEGLVERQDEVLETRAIAASPGSSISPPGSANGATSSPSPSAHATSGPASGSIRTRRTPIPILAPRRWSRAPTIRA